MTALSPASDLFRDLPTPCLVLDRDALVRNIDAMAAMARQAGVTLRPHAKTHKSPHIAVLQIGADCTVGIACATVAEADAMAAAGIRNLLLTSPLMGQAKLARLAQINRANPLGVVVDHPLQVEALCEVLEPGDPPLSVVIDVDVGHARTGVTDAAAAVALARLITQRRELAFCGIQGFAGHAQHMLDPAERRKASEDAAATLRSFALALNEAGIPVRVITGSGTGTHRLDAGSVYNELQVGSYIFMDADYARIADEQGRSLAFMPSLFVLTTVVSANRPGQVTVDAGTKALATNGPMPSIVIGAPPGARYRFAGDEHGIIGVPAGEAIPRLGARLLLGATHCDPTVNLQSRYHVVSEDGIETWPIRGRYGD